ncbi:MAG: type II toxin-antitoxin system death-on-curing family toxin [Planctomycetes bacterium]|nr:type II toxin-antitoxin system death-on-curing family toxin [Planctomycetota bacterium]
MNNGRCEYLTTEDILRLHKKAIVEYGGNSFLRDAGLLESALAQPMAAFGGVQFHPTLAEKAATYLFHLSKNHPFENGNKRIAVIAAIVFLDINGYTVNAGINEFMKLTLNVIEGKTTKAEVAQFLEARMTPRNSIQ